MPLRASLMAAMAAAAIGASLTMVPLQAALPPAGSSSAGRLWADAAQRKEKQTGYGSYARQAREPARRHFGQRGHKGRGYGFVADCEWLRGRAVTGHSPVWWRKYKQQCLGR